MKASIPPDEAQRLAALREYGVGDARPVPGFDDLTLLAAQICGTPIAVICFVDDQRQWFKSSLGLSATATSRDMAFCAHAILRSAELLEVSDARFDARFSDDLLVTGEPHVRFFVGAPLVSPEGQVLGVICALDTVPRSLDDQQRAALRALGRQAVVHLSGATFQSSFVPVRDASGAVIRLMGQTLDISERSRREDAQRLTDAAFKAITQGVIVSGLDERIVSVNDAFSSITGYRSDEILGQNCRFLQGPDTDPQTVAAIRNALRTRTVFAGEILNYRKDGSQFWNELTVSPVKDAQGSVTHFIGITRDITMRCLAEQTLRESELQLKRVIRGGDLAFWDWNAVTGGLEVNDRWFEMLGLAREAGTPSIEFWHSLVHPEDMPKLERLAVEVIQNPAGRELEVEIRARHSDGHYIWILDKASVVARAVDGSPLRVVGTHMDITARKEAEAALRLSEARYRRVMLGTNEGLWEWNIETGEEYCSPRWLETLGYDPGAEVRDFESFTNLIHPEDVAHVMATSDAAIRERKPFKTEMRLRCRDGSYMWVLSRAFVDFDPDGKPKTMTGSIADLTATREIEQQLRQSQKLEAIGTLAGGIAHDFNNILAGIYGFTSLAREAAGDNLKLCEYLDEISRAGRRAAELVRQILAFSRSQADDGTVATVSLPEIASEAIQLLRAASPSSIEIVQDITPGLPTVQVNATQFHQIIMNLGTNAVHAMRDHPGLLTVRLEPCVVDETLAGSLPGLLVGPGVRLTISDTGTGMDAVTQQRVFEPFFTTKGPGQGTGLGLSVVHGMVSKCKGAIRLSSAIGRGTTFEVFLPAGFVAPSAIPPEPFLVARAHGERILVVDDEPAITKAVELTLLQLGYVVDAETDVLKALARLERDPLAYQLVISDQTMPGMTGLEFATRIRALRSDLPVVLASGDSTKLTRDQIRAAGVLQVMDKPYSRAVLVSVVGSHLRRPGSPG